ncbi:hypothetical protein MRX96_021659 [Rhipicephalus microplus]
MSNTTTPKYNVSYLILKIDNATLSVQSPFNHSEDPTILKISPLKGFVRFPPVNAKAYRQLPSSDRQKSLGKDNRIAGESHTGLGTS